MQQFNDFTKVYKGLYEKRLRKECLDKLFSNGFLVSYYYWKKLMDEKSLVIEKRLKALKDNYKVLKKENLFYWDIDDYLPEADCAIYDLSDRCNTLRSALDRIIRTINYTVPPHEIYMYNPDGKSGYKWYAGQKLVVFQVVDDLSINDLRKLFNDVRLNKVKDYDFTDPLHAVKKVILLTRKCDEMYNWLRFDLGDDGYELSKLWQDAWNGLMHVWRFKDGTPAPRPSAFSTPETFTPITDLPRVFKVQNKKQKGNACKIAQFLPKTVKKESKSIKKEKFKPKKNSPGFYLIQVD